MRAKFLKCFWVIVCSIAFFIFMPLTTVANAPDTFFMHPDFGATNNVPDSVTSTPDVWFELWSSGNNLCLLNLNGLDAVISEAVTIAYPAGRKYDSVDVFTNEADLSAANINDLTNAGWPRMDVTYKYWRIVTDLQTTDSTFAPRVISTDNSAINARMIDAGFTDQFATIDISGLTLPTVAVLYYEPAFKFLSRSNYVYKYVTEGNYFVFFIEGTYNRYDPKVLEIDTWNHDFKVTDGTYVITGSKLPDNLLEPVYEDIKVAVVAENTEDNSGADAIASWKFEVSNSDEYDKEQAKEKYEEVAAFVQTFDAAVELYWNEYNEISMDLAYSGALPEGTVINVTIPKDGDEYADGTTLYLYYCNPDTLMNEFMAEGVVEGGEVAFSMEHCSEYIITDIDHGETYTYVVEEAEEIVIEEVVSEDTVIEQPVCIEPEEERSKPNNTIIVVAVIVLILAGGAIALVLGLKSKKKK